MSELSDRLTNMGLPWPIIGAAAWVFPGLGHFLLGERLRGIIVACTLIPLFLAGVYIGGVDVVDREKDRLWFAGQVLIGPTALVVDYVRSSNKPPNHSIGRVNELGTLYSALAGVMNLLVILDVVGRTEEENTSSVEPPGGVDRRRTV